ncbi:MAG: A24 family peptidase [Planctomycetaceae bacterium]|nr:A24 family peptidase [Planctomycetaceae bacterium]
MNYVVLAIVGTVIGALLNRLADQWGWHKRFRSPWSRIPETLILQTDTDVKYCLKNQKKNKSPKNRLSAPLISFKKRYFDFLPLIGWLTFSRFSVILGPNFWVRPFCVELFCSLGVPFLYHWGIVQKNLSIFLPGMTFESEITLYTRFVLLVIFFSFLLLATLTDFDDFIISDLITVPGTVFGLLAGTFLTFGLLPATEIVVFPETAKRSTVFHSDANLIPTTDPQVFYRNENVPLHLASPNPWPIELVGRPNFLTLFLGLCCWWGWCFAMMNRVWRMNFGFKQAVSLFLRRLRRSQSTWSYLLAALLGSLVITILWNGETYWQGAFSALTGMTVGGGIIWTVRLVAAQVLHLEAMGFGDVTFMAMIGAFLGWQPCLFIFFIAPVAGLIVGIIRWLLGYGNMLPYGPYLALATLLIVLFWPSLWLWAEPFFEVGWLIPAMMLFCGIMLFLLLKLLEIIKRRLGFAFQ